MSIVIIPEDITEEELEARARAVKQSETPKPPPKPRGWEVYWQKREPTIPYDPPPPITPEEMRAFRESKGWFQKHLAKRTSYSIHTIKHMEQGLTPISPTLSSMIRLMMEVDELKEENARLKALQEPA